MQIGSVFLKLLQALPVTLIIVLVAAAAGLLFGTLLAVARLERVPVLRQFSAVMVSFLRGTPILIQMFLIYYGLPALLLPIGLDLRRADKLLFVLITYGLNTAAFFSEIIRSAVLAVPKAQWDAAAACGLTRRQSAWRVVIPQSARIALPSLGLNITSLLQDSSLAFSLGILDVMGRAHTLGALTGQVIEPYLAAAVLFIVLTIALEQCVKLIEKRVMPV